MNGIEGEEMAGIAKDGNLHVVNFTTYGYVFMWKINKKNVKKEILNSFSYDMNTRISLKMRTFAPELERIRWNH